MFPEFSRASVALHGFVPPVKLAKVDATENAQLAAEYDVKGYPKLKIFDCPKAGDVCTPEEYAGPRDEDGIVDYIKAVARGEPPPAARKKAGNHPADIREPLDSKVVKLHEQDFDSFIAEHELVVVEFYAHWCAVSKKFAPIYSSASKALDEAGIKVAKINAAERGGNKIGQRFDVKGFPTLKVFAKGEVGEYTGKRTESSLISTLLALQGGAASSSAKAASEEL